MSLLQKPLSATIEVVYSDARKNEMRITKQTDCVLVHNIVKKIISKHCDGNVKTIIPTNKDRYSDICFDFSVSSEDVLIKIQNEIKDQLKESLKTVDGFVFAYDDSF